MNKKGRLLIKPMFYIILVKVSKCKYDFILDVMLNRKWGIMLCSMFANA